MNILQQAFRNIQQNTPRFIGNVVQNAIPGMRAVSQVARQAQRVPQVQQMQNRVMNTRIIPGQQNTFNQVRNNVIQDPAKYILSSSLAQGRLNTGVKPIDTNIVRPTGHAVNALIQSSSAGLVQPPSAPTQTWQDKVGAGVGFGAGMLNPYNVGAKVLNPMGLKVAGAIGGKLATRQLPQLVKSGIGAVGSEAAQTAALTAGNMIQGNKFDPASALAQGLGLRGLGGAYGKAIGKGIAKHRTRMADGDIQSVKDTIFRMLDKKTNLDYAVNNKKADEVFLRQMAADYLDKGFAQKAKLDDVAQELMNRIRVDQGAREITLPTMGIKGNDDFIPQARPGSRSNVKREDPRIAQEMQPNALPWEKDPLDQMMNQSKLNKPNTQRAYDTDAAKQAADNANINMFDNKKEFDNVFAKWIGKREAATTTGTQLGYKYKSIPKDQGKRVIQALEEPGSIKGDDVVTSSVNALHKDFDDLYNSAKKNGVDIGYRENYITHFWDKPEDEVVQAYQVFKRKEFIQNERTVPTYREGIEMGLTPKYSQPAPIIADYTQRLEKLKANLEFIDDAKKKGFVVDASVGLNQPGFTPITAPGFPKSISEGVDGKTVVGHFYAPSEIANVINKQFSEAPTDMLSKSMSMTNKISGVLQDVGLSGGVPFTPMNAFTTAQIQKELLSGRLYSPISSFIRSVSPKMTNNFFHKNAEQIKKMQLRNVPVHSSYDIGDVLGKEPPEGLKGKAGELWAKAMSDPTFKRFMPMLQVNLFNNIENQALRAGKNGEEAADTAARAVREFMGVTGSDELAKRSQLGKDIAGTFLFAPRYRESMIRFWVNNAKSVSPLHVTKEGVKLNNPFSLENKTNTKFVAGSLLALGSMNYINEQLNGHGMSENPPGKEDKLLIPLEDGTVIGIPWLSSIATIPRGIYRQGKMLAQGNVKDAVLDAGSTYLSMGAKPLFDVAKNSDYFGKEIASETDLPQEKLAKQGKYLATQYLSHPYLKEGLDSRNQGDPLYQRASRASELPLRFYDKSSMDKSAFYDQYYKAKPLAEKYEELSWKDPDKAQAFLQQNQQAIDTFNYQKQVQNAYYDLKDAGTDDPTILANNLTPQQGVTQVGNRMVFRNEKGNWDNINLNPDLKAPELTGNTELDKKLVSSYKGKLTSYSNDIKQLYELGVLDAGRAEQMLRAVEVQRGTYNKPRKPKKVRALKVRKVSANTGKPITFKVPKLPKLKLTKEKKPKKLKTSRFPVLKVKERKEVT